MTPDPDSRISSLTLGDYTKEAIDFSKYESSCFRPSLITKRETPLFATMGCGLSAVYTLTGHSPTAILKCCIDKNIDFFNGTSAAELILLLREFGHTALPINLRDVCPKKKLIEERINDKHVILAAQWVAKDELSWFVIWDNLEFHTHCLRPVNSRSFINNPIDQMILVHHRSWEVDLPTLPNERPIPARRNEISIRISNLNKRILELQDKLAAVTESEDKKVYRKELRQLADEVVVIAEEHEARISLK